MEGNWWEHSLNAKQRAYHQLFDETLRYPWRQFHVDVEELLGHPVYSEQFGSAGIEQLRLEAIKNYRAAGYND
jgi:hypothetical protein